MAGVDDPVSSPMALVQDYLRSKGLQSTSENVRRTLEQAARDPTFMPGLKTEEPPPADQRAPSSGGRSVADKIEGQGGSGSGTGRGLATPPPPPADLSQVPNAEDYKTTANLGGASTTSAQPTAGYPLGGGSEIGAVAPGGLDLGTAILGGGGLASLPFIGRYLSGSGVAAPPVAAAPTPDVAPAAPPVSDMEMALQKATAPAANSLEAARPPVDLPSVNAGMPNVTGTSMPQPGEGNIPLPKRKVTIEEVHPQSLPSFRTRPPMRLFVP